MPFCPKILFLLLEKFYKPSYVDVVSERLPRTTGAVPVADEDVHIQSCEEALNKGVDDGVGALS